MKLQNWIIPSRPCHPHVLSSRAKTCPPWRRDLSNQALVTQITLRMISLSVPSLRQNDARIVSRARSCRPRVVIPKQSRDLSIRHRPRITSVINPPLRGQRFARMTRELSFARYFPPARVVIRAKQLARRGGSRVKHWSHRLLCVINSLCGVLAPLRMTRCRRALFSAPTENLRFRSSGLSFLDVAGAIVRVTDSSTRSDHLAGARLLFSRRRLLPRNSRAS
jgi:hypothetical protein